MWSIENTISRRAECDVIDTGECSPVNPRYIRDEREAMIEGIERWLSWNQEVTRMLS